MTRISSRDNTETMQGFSNMLRFMDGKEYKTFTLGRVPMMAVYKEEEGTDTPVHIDVIMYDTCIIKLYADATFRLDNGGWNTNTTRRFMNIFLQGWTVTSKKAIYTHTGKEFDYFNGMHLGLDAIKSERDIEVGIGWNDGTRLSDLIMQGFTKYPTKTVKQFFEYVGFGADKHIVAACAWGCVRAAVGITEPTDVHDYDFLATRLGYDPFTWITAWSSEICRSTDFDGNSETVYQAITVMNDYRNMTVPDISAYLRNKGY